MKKTGLADSPFFKQTVYEQNAVTPSLSVDKESKESGFPASEKRVNKNDDTVIPRYNETMTPRYQETIIELVRRGVKDFGKEAATHRFTLPEKKAISDIIYTYKNRGIKTSENEITRIAINFLVEDFRENGERSVLAKTLKALNG